MKSSIFNEDNPKSIKKPNKIGDNAVEKTIKDIVIDLMAPKFLVPYISDQVEVIKTFAVPLVIAIKMKNKIGENIDLNKTDIMKPKIIGIK